MKIDITKEIVFRTARSGGKGGQNVNKVETMVEGYFSIPGSSILTDQQKAVLEKKVERLEAKELVGIRNVLLQKDEIINQVNFIGAIVEVSTPDALKKLCGDLKNHLRDFVVVLCANIGGKAAVAIALADTVVAAKGLDANQLIKQRVAPLIKGGGGGQKTLATAGGQEAGNLTKVIDSIRESIV